MESIKEILMTRDNMSGEEAEELIAEAQDELDNRLINNDLDGAENICMEYFNLEPDYIMELIHFGGRQ